jgi:hypothetical protein
VFFLFSREKEDRTETKQGLGNQSTVNRSYWFGSFKQATETSASTAATGERASSSSSYVKFVLKEVKERPPAFQADVRDELMLIVKPGRSVALALFMAWPDGLHVATGRTRVEGGTRCGEKMSMRLRSIQVIFFT